MVDLAFYLAGIPFIALLAWIAYRRGKASNIPEFDGGFSHDGLTSDGIRITTIKSSHVRTDG